MTVKEYILQNFDKTIRQNERDEGVRLGLPYPYTVPSMSGVFDVMYYWDTYFTNKGLILAERTDIAKSNCDNVAYLINRFGYMPNGSHKYLLGRSQPPFFALMVKDVFEKTQDKQWLKSMLSPLLKENEFWSQKRNTQTGLNRYYGDYSKEQSIDFYNNVKDRIKITENRDQIEGGFHYFAEAESGWDFTPRFDGRCADYNPVDLNSLLYMQEEFIFNIYTVFGDCVNAEKWKIKAQNRKSLINKLTFNNSLGMYSDYDYKNATNSNIVSCAGFMPYFAKIAPLERVSGLSKLLNALEKEFGLSTTEKTNANFQWGYENAWAPLYLIAVVALDNYGYIQDAQRIAKKYMTLVNNNFEKTGGLWEKYNALTGGIDAVSEYGTPEMMGWTAGTYLFMEDYLNKSKK